MAEGEHLLGSAHVHVLARCSPEHMASGCDSVCPCALIQGGVVAGACLDPLYLWGVREGRHLPREMVGICQYPKHM